MGFFDVYDQYLLNILYDPRVRPGMTREDLGKLALEVLPTVRAWVAGTNPPPDAAARSSPTAASETSAKNALRSAPRRVPPGRG